MVPAGVPSRDDRLPTCYWIPGSAAPTCSESSVNAALQKPGALRKLTMLPFGCPSLALGAGRGTRWPKHERGAVELVSPSEASFGDLCLDLLGLGGGVRAGSRSARVACSGVGLARLAPGQPGLASGHSWRGPASGMAESSYEESCSTWIRAAYGSAVAVRIAYRLSLLPCKYDGNAS